MNRIINELAGDYPFLYLNPDEDNQEAYNNAVLMGVMPAGRNLSHYSDGENDSLEFIDTPAGQARVVTIGNRKDFELVIRGFGAVKDGPKHAVPANQGAAMFSAFNWRKINGYLGQFDESRRKDEFKKFTGNKENYVDRIIILSRAPYSGISGEIVGESAERWLELSHNIRCYHELTHFVCRKLYPKDIDIIRDEVIADAIGIYSAYGSYDENLAKLFLGISGGSYVGGRLENYTEKPEQEIEKVLDVIERCKEIIKEHHGTDALELIQLFVSV